MPSLSKKGSKVIVQDTPGFFCAWRTVCCCFGGLFWLKLNKTKSCIRKSWIFPPNVALPLDVQNSFDFVPPQTTLLAVSECISVSGFRILTFQSSAGGIAPVPDRSGWHNVAPAIPELWHLQGVRSASWKVCLPYKVCILHRSRAMTKQISHNSSCEANLGAMNLKSQLVNPEAACSFSSTALKDIYHKSVKGERLTGLGFIESAAYLCSVFCQ